ncbi:MAG TPA: Imm74 family immunity protein [Longimicrobium sp.]|nr:Imm74 family immunity protein [Longimicrobium sp.]
MFEKLKKHIGRFPDFSVWPEGRTALRYSEGERTMLVKGEALAAGEGWVVYTNSIERWDPPFQGEEISPEKQVRIAENIRTALEFQKQKVEFDVLRPTPPGWVGGQTFEVPIRR